MAWLVATVVLLVSALEAISGPAVRISVGRNNYCPPVQRAPIFCRPAPLYPTVPIVYQPYGAACLTPIYYSIGPTTVTYTTGNFTTQSFGAPVTTVTPLVVPPPVIINRPVMVYPDNTFRWKR